MTAELPALSDADRIDLERLCDVAYSVIESRRGVVSANDRPDPDIGAALAAITERLVEAGIGRGVAEQTTTRWYITRAAGGGRVPILDCLAIEADPPYPTSRMQADLGHRGTRELRRGPD